MKTATIDLLKKDLLIVELPRKSDLEIFPNSIEIYNQFTGQEETIKGSYTLLGSPDEIKEEDAKELVKTGSYTTTFWNYKTNDTHKSNQLRTAKESLLSALESEIYWENPEPKLSDLEYFLPSINEGIKLQKRFDKAQENTFDKKRTLIFFKN